MRLSITYVVIIAGLAWFALAASDAFGETGWSGKRPISFQRQNDLFYNYYVGPEPSGTAAEMYVSPLPTPERVGHTYTTYQPLMPHEYTYGHKRSWWTHNPGAGWTRTKVRYGAGGSFLQAIGYQLNRPYHTLFPAFRE